MVASSSSRWGEVHWNFVFVVEGKKITIVVDLSHHLLFALGVLLLVIKNDCKIVFNEGTACTMVRWTYNQIDTRERVVWIENSLFLCFSLAFYILHMHEKFTSIYKQQVLPSSVHRLSDRRRILSANRHIWPSPCRDTLGILRRSAWDFLSRHRFRRSLNDAA